MNRGSSRKVFDPGIPNIPPFRITNQGEPGVGVLFGLSGFYRQPQGDQSGWSLDWALQWRKYHNDIYDSATASLRLGLRYRRNQTHWSFGTFARQTWRNDKDDNFAVGVDAAVEQYVSDRHSFFVNAVVEERQYPNSDGSDASFYSSQVGLRFTPDADTQLTFGARLDANRPDTLHQGYESYALFGNASKSWSGGIKTDIGLEIGSRDYHADFPLTVDQRDDDYYRIEQHYSHQDGLFMGSPRQCYVRIRETTRTLRSMTMMLLNARCVLLEGTDATSYAAMYLGTRDECCNVH